MKTMETREVSLELTRWSGATAMLSTYSTTLSRMLIDLYLPQTREYGMIVLVGVKRYCGPLRWVVHDLNVVMLDQQVTCIRDSAANLTIEGDVAGMAVGTPAELLEFFKNFHPADGN